MRRNNRCEQITEAVLRWKSFSSSIVCTCVYEYKVHKFLQKVGGEREGNNLICTCVGTWF